MAQRQPCVRGHGTVCGGLRSRSRTFACVHACMQVAWLSEGPTTGEPNEVRYADEDMGRLRVVDRGLMTGDVVASADNPLGQVAHLAPCMHARCMRPGQSAVLPLMRPVKT